MGGCTLVSATDQRTTPSPCLNQACVCLENKFHAENSPSMSGSREWFSGSEQHPFNGWAGEAVGWVHTSRLCVITWFFSLWALSTCDRECTYILHVCMKKLTHTLQMKPGIKTGCKSHVPLYICWMLTRVTLNICKNKNHCIRIAHASNETCEQGSNQGQVETYRTWCEVTKYEDYVGSVWSMVALLHTYLSFMPSERYGGK